MPRRPRGPYRKGVERRLEVVVVAVDVFGRYGFKGGTLHQVAERVGLTPAAIVKLFGSKERLLIAVLEHWDVETELAMDANSGGVVRFDGFRRLMAYHVNHPGLLELYTTMAVEATSPEHPAHAFMTNRYRNTLVTFCGFFKEAVEEGHFGAMTADEIRNEAECLLATMDGLEIQFLLNPSFDLQASFSAFLDRLLLRLSANGIVDRD